MFILIPNGPDHIAHTLDTDEEVQAARAALSKAEIDVTDVWTGDPEDPDAYRNGQKLWAEATR